VPEPGPVGVNVEPLGEEFGPSVLPEGLAVLFGYVTAPPVPELPVVVPFIEEPVVVPLAAEPPAVELPPAEPPEDPPLCASANVLESAKAVASAIVLSFIVVSLCSGAQITAANYRSFRKKRHSARKTISSRFTSRRGYTDQSWSFQDGCLLSLADVGSSAVKRTSLKNAPRTAFDSKATSQVIILDVRPAASASPLYLSRSRWLNLYGYV
jgi:hypothetical protein